MRPGLEDVAEAGRYADPRLLFLDMEARRYAVAIVPVDDVTDGERRLVPLHQGSGTCVRIGGRYLVATAAHVVSDVGTDRYAVLTPVTTKGALKVVGGGHRGGQQGDARDVGWLELAPGAARLAGRAFLDLPRFAAYRTGVGDDLAVYGAPAELGIKRTVDGEPHFTAVSGVWPTRAMTEEQVGPDTTGCRIFLDWPSSVECHDGSYERYPEASGISGGAIWALNLTGHGDAWRADQMQLIGVQFAVQKANGYRYLIGQQMQTWLEMVAEDIPELRREIEQHLAACSLASTLG